MPSRTLLIDTDAGLDDAVALMMALACSEHKILGITTVTGNVHVNKVYKNVVRILHKCNRQHTIPVYNGASEPLIHETTFAEYFHGEDGLGDVLDDVTYDETLKVEEEHGVSAIIRLGKLQLDMAPSLYASYMEYS